MERFTVAPEDQNEEPEPEIQAGPESKDKKKKRKRRLREEGGRVGLAAISIEKNGDTDSQTDKKAERAKEKDYVAKLLADAGIKKELKTESEPSETKESPETPPTVEAAQSEEKLSTDSQHTIEDAESDQGPTIESTDVPNAEESYRLDEAESGELYNRQLQQDELNGGEVIIDQVDRSGAEEDSETEASSETAFEPVTIPDETLPLNSQTEPVSPAAETPRTANTASEQVTGAEGGETSQTQEAVFRNGTNSRPSVPPTPPTPPGARFNIAVPPPFPPNVSRTFAATPDVLRPPVQSERVVVKRSARDFWAGAAAGALIEHSRHKRKEKKLARHMDRTQQAQTAELKRVSFENQLLQRKQERTAGEVAAVRASVGQPERASFARPVQRQRAEVPQEHVRPLEKSPASAAVEQTYRPVFLPGPGERAKAVFRTDITEAARGGLPGVRSERQKAAEKMAESVRTRVIAEATNKEDQWDELKLPKGHRIERSAWHNIEVDVHTGRAVEDSAIEYGKEYYKERAHERSGADDFVGAAATGVALAAIAATRARTHTVADAKLEGLNSTDKSEGGYNKKSGQQRGEENSGMAAKKSGVGKTTAAAAKLATAGKDAGRYIASAATDAAKKTIDTVSHPPTTNAGVAGWTIALLALLLGLLMMAL